MIGDWIHPTTLTLVLHIVVVTAALVRVIMTRPATGVALAWSLLITSLPVFGVLIYLLIGERRISRDRARGIEALRTDYKELYNAAIELGLTRVDWACHDWAALGLDRLGRSMLGSPTVRGCRLELFTETGDIMTGIIRDLDRAESSVLMEFYIWHEGGLADDVLEAVLRAARRGVSCRLLIDALGARPWWRGDQPERLREAGVDVRPALPVGLLRTFIGRTDLRLHRKIVVIDGTAAWTGSMNLVDPRFFKQDAGVGQWVDAMVRVQGSVVVPLATTMIGDWILETGESLDDVIGNIGLERVRPSGPADVQVIPSGPGQSGDGLLQMILALIHSAQEELTLTTPYLVPDDSLMRALRGAAARGVRVRVIVPERVDSFLTRYASRSYYDGLLEVGVEVHLYQAGLLHTKSIMVDGKRSMFGTVNFDMRSFWLNYEVALFVYEASFAEELKRLQQRYLDDSQQIDPEAWAKRSFAGRFMENLLRLFSPLL